MLCSSMALVDVAATVMTRYVLVELSLDEIDSHIVVVFLLILDVSRNALRGV
jgi:hypothetical protein